MDASSNTINWFEIPTKNMEKAKAFYQEVFQVAFVPYEMPGFEMKMETFPSTPGSSFVGGALVESANHHPAQGGAVVYLNANPSIDAVIERIAPAGGMAITGKISLGPNGFMALFIDVDGNTIGLHANA
jgi:predicted enzyme related to lactoylglutathione lyase